MMERKPYNEAFTRAYLADHTGQPMPVAGDGYLHYSTVRNAPLCGKPEAVRLVLHWELVNCPECRTTSQPHEIAETRPEPN